MGCIYSFIYFLWLGMPLLSCFISSLCTVARRASIAPPSGVCYDLFLSYVLSLVGWHAPSGEAGAWWGPGACFIAGCAATRRSMAMCEGGGAPVFFLVPLHRVATVRLRHSLAWAFEGWLLLLDSTLVTCSPCKKKDFCRPPPLSTSMGHPPTNPPSLRTGRWFS